MIKNAFNKALIANNYTKGEFAKKSGIALWRVKVACYGGMIFDNDQKYNLSTLLNKDIDELFPEYEHKPLPNEVIERMAEHEAGIEYDSKQKKLVRMYEAGYRQAERRLLGISGFSLISMKELIDGNDLNEAEIDRLALKMRT